MLPFNPDLSKLPAPDVEVAASPARRVLALAALYALGVLIIWGGMQASSQGGAGPLRLVAVIALGAGFLLAAERMRRVTHLSIILDADGLRDSGGTVLAAWDDIEKVERGSFANKPSNGFSVVLKSRGPRGWAPGLWWRVGRRVGVGGVLPGRPTRFMGEQMALWLRAREER